MLLCALEETACVGGNTGWQVAHLTLKDGAQLIGAMPLYLKQHSYGEFVFDWSWAQAYEQQGMEYFPKALCAIPFTPVQGPRILGDKDVDLATVQKNLITGLKTLVTQNNLSSAHILFPTASEAKGFQEQGFMLRDSVQFHWHNQGFEHFEQFLAALTMKRRKNIRREREQVARELINFRHVPGESSSDADWEFFYRCYENTYVEHQSSPYLSEAFFKLWAQRMPENLHLIIAERSGNPIAASLLVVDHINSKAYGRYWGALEHVPCLHREHQGIGAYVDELAEHSPPEIV
ncbi:GNAT family N-acetyltransferase [Polynucleobacter necessarius]|uniref:GNAT family N-acetyltransferase n=1 Tax=Polynucleobacter necessarius TaxID=576610 RepID=UPI001E3AE2FC|nr:GNAT family N-acetyltransferase [Polynucleobacter necessarius]